MEKSEKIKRIVLIALAVLASGYFMYSGFSILMTEDTNTSSQTLEGVKLVE